MSLIGFHRVLIATAILFCLGFAGLTGASFLQDGGTGSLVLAVVFLGAGLGLAYYLRHLNRMLGREE
jgi:hypothetical protein